MTYAGSARSFGEQTEAEKLSQLLLALNPGAATHSGLKAAGATRSAVRMQSEEEQAEQKKRVDLQRLGITIDDEGRGNIWTVEVPMIEDESLGGISDFAIPIGLTLLVLASLPLWTTIFDANVD